jgi:hypothetical protein
MELLIPGLILVALMVWASTKIKDKAAAAFRPETIETEEFVIRKPDGFLHVINDDSDLAFRAYSQEYGKNELNGDRQATIELDIHPDADLEEVLRIVSQNGALSEVQTYLDAGENAVTFVLDAEESDPRRVNRYKLVKRGDKIFELCFSVLYHYREAFSDAIDEAITNFQAK